VKKNENRLYKLNTTAVIELFFTSGVYFVKSMRSELLYQWCLFFKFSPSGEHHNHENSQGSQLSTPNSSSGMRSAAAGYWEWEQVPAMKKCNFSYHVRSKI